MPQTGIPAFVARLPVDLRPIVRALRAVVKATVPQTQESVLWGSLSYHRPAVGGRVKGAVCLITAKRGQVRLEFIHGVRLKDPAALLRGERISKRYVPIPTASAAQRPELAALIRAAAEVEFTSLAAAPPASERPRSSPSPPPFGTRRSATGNRKPPVTTTSPPSPSAPGPSPW